MSNPSDHHLTLQRGSFLTHLLSPLHAAVEMGMRSLTNQTSTERIYSVSQLSDALQSGLMGLKDQLQVCPGVGDSCCTHSNSIQMFAACVR